ncbi:MAG: hypothetical protein S0880_12285 [Actinomycetota bacterium]|nr:hypothetical protein [Actinomycetota bacterium]
MTSQMQLIDAHTSRPVRRRPTTDAPLAAADHRLDEHTKQVGRRGLALAREALAAARPAWSPPPEAPEHEPAEVPAAA